MVQSFGESIKRRSFNKEILFFPNWAESLFEDQEVEEDLELPILPNGFNVLFAGNIGEAQDFETILLAANLTKKEKINWILIGEGRKLDWVKHQVEINNLHNVYIYGRFPIEKMPAFFRKADIMLLTLKFSDISKITVPAKLQAYLASGKIILGAIDGEANSIINENKVGLACKSGDFKLLSEYSILLKNLSIEERVTMENNSQYLYYRQFSKKMLLDKLEKLFNSNINIE